MERTGGMQKPIGYWLKRIDALLTRHIDRAQQATGLTRTTWQVLNVVQHLGGARQEEVAEALSPFVDAEGASAAAHELSRRGWIDGDGSAERPYALSAEGRRVHARALEVQQQVRHRAMHGISPDDYAVTLRVLATMAANLEADD
ncbi:MAG TPA: MarR family winged helix-turn-helix transcriptional regulator [Vicinamibacterales bacterium]